MRRRLWVYAFSALGLVLASAANAAEVKVVAAGALREALTALVNDYELKTGTKVTITAVNPALIGKEMATTRYDVVAAATPAIAEMADGGNLLEPKSVRPLARTGIGIAVKAGAPKPDVSTVTTFKTAVKNAKSIIYTDPSVPNASGAVTQHILTNAGLLDIVKAKGKQDGLGPGREKIAKGDYEMGFFNVSEATAPGVVLAGPVPAPLQQYTNYEVALMKDAPNAKDAAAFVRFLTSKAASTRWTQAGLEQRVR
jgi:molybdate transport system substrate-binding protein